MSRSFTAMRAVKSKLLLSAVMIVRPFMRVVLYLFPPAFIIIMSSFLYLFSHCDKLVRSFLRLLL